MTSREAPGSTGKAPQRKEIDMLKKALVIAVLGATVAAGALSKDASAQGDPVLGALVGAGIGAAIGHSVDGSNGAWVGGALGAVTGASIAASSGGYYNNGYSGGGYYGPSAAYVAPAPVYYAPALTYYRPAPVYYAPPAVVYRPRPVAYAAPYAWHYRTVRWGHGPGRNPGRPTPYAYGRGH